MAIESITGRTPNTAPQKSVQKTDTHAKQQSTLGAKASDDKVEITSVMQDIKKALESSTSEPIVNQDRVTAIKQSIADGTYEVNAEKIAEKMIQFNY